MTFRLWRKKFYKEVKCMACDGSGTSRIRYVDAYTHTQIGELSYIACKCCKGRGTQTVLERVE